MIDSDYLIVYGSEFENEQEDLAKQTIRSTHSSISTQAVIPESAVDRNEESTRQRILFSHKNDPYYFFTNFSPHPVIYKGKEYPTSEHLYQFFKV